jgi:hypothetical protein
LGNLEKNLMLWIRKCGGKAKGTWLKTKSRLLPNHRGGIIAQNKCCCAKAKGTRLLTKSRLLPSHRGEIIAHI